jgi:hypothetical protein
MESSQFSTASTKTLACRDHQVSLSFATIEVTDELQEDLPPPLTDFGRQRTLGATACQPEKQSKVRRHRQLSVDRLRRQR